MEITAFDLAQRFLGVKEAAGAASNPHVVAMLRLDVSWPGDDDVAWCSAFVNYVAWLLRLPRSKSLGARSWLQVGRPVTEREAATGFDVVILQRGDGKQPGPEVIKAQGHVGFFAGWDFANGVQLVRVLGGNQGNAVTVATFPAERILGIRRLV